MAQESRFLQYLLVILFAAAVTMLGAHELHRQYAQGKEKGDTRKLIAELHGEELDFERAGISKQALEVAAKRTSPESKQDRLLLERLLHRLLPKPEKKE